MGRKFGSSVVLLSGGSRHFRLHTTVPNLVLSTTPGDYILRQ